MSVVILGLGKMDTTCLSIPAAVQERLKLNENCKIKFLRTKEGIVLRAENSLFVDGDNKQKRVVGILLLFDTILDVKIPIIENQF